MLPTRLPVCTTSSFQKVVGIVKEAENNDTEAATCPMTWGEENALRYITGYVCRKVHGKLAKSSVKDKEEMVLFCVELCGDEEDEHLGTEEWTNTIDRGGLWHVSDNTYTVFTILEEEIRRHLKVSALNDLNEVTKKTILEATLKNEELLFRWTLITASADDSEQTMRLHLKLAIYSCS